MFNIFNKQETLEKLLFTDSKLNTGSAMLESMKQLIKQRGEHTKAIKQLNELIEQHKNMDTSVIAMYNDLKKMALSKDYKNLDVQHIIDTELFDFSNVKNDKQLKVGDPDSIKITKNIATFVISSEIPDLPFENCLIKALEIEDKSCIFIHLMEYSPIQLVGSIMMKTALLGTMTITFVIHKDTKIMTVNLANAVVMPNGRIIKDNNPESNMLTKHLYCTGIMEVARVLFVFEKMSKHSVLVDTIPKTEYINYKVGKERKKKVIYNRPIYYILDKETYNKGTYNINPISKLEYSFAFKVRGHWRRIAQDSLGKDRNGIYNTQGYTWVMDYIKGEGELVKRTRVAKGTI